MSLGRYGNVTSSLIPLDEIDWVRGSGSGTGAVELIVELNQRELLRCPRINHLLETKWNKYAHRVFKRRLRNALLFLIGFISLTLLDKRRQESVVFNANGVANKEMLAFWVIEVTLCCGTASKLYDELLELYIEGVASYLLPRGVMENVCSLSACFCFLASRPLKLYMASTLAAPALEPTAGPLSSQAANLTNLTGSNATQGDLVLTELVSHVASFNLHSRTHTHAHTRTHTLHTHTHTIYTYHIHHAR